MTENIALKNSFDNKKKISFEIYYDFFLLEKK